mmetsp:Transcript_21847/g.41674  ORF Transcript_21847/g.41674 Transcript_21847/m.41674 type:complete len:112 (+) Transcript_21847:267-602(+)
MKAGYVVRHMSRPNFVKGLLIMSRSFLVSRNLNKSGAHAVESPPPIWVLRWQLLGLNGPCTLVHLPSVLGTPLISGHFRQIMQRRSHKQIIFAPGGLTDRQRLDTQWYGFI